MTGFNAAFGPDFLASMRGYGAAPISFDPAVAGAPLTVTPGTLDVGITPSSAMGGAGGGGFLGGLNMDTAKLALGGLQTLGQLWGAFQSANLAKKQFNFTKDITETNLANQIRSYNTGLEDRARSRAVVEGQTAGQTADYIERNRARRGG